MERQLAPPQLVTYEFGQLSCLGHLENRTPPPFDYYKFGKYQIMCSDKEKVERLLAILKGGNVKAVEEYNFEEEFLLLYGSMNRSSAKYKAILKEYKVSKVEEMKAWENDEKFAKELVLSGKKSEINELIKKNEDKLAFYQFQYAEACPQFSNLSPIAEEKSKAKDWFILPRPTLVDINRRKNTFSISWKSVYGLDINKKDVVKGINLGVLDPLVCFPDIALTPKGSPPFNILTTFRAFLNSNPRGMVKQVFWKRFEEKYDYMPEISNLGFPESHALFNTYPDVFYILVLDGRPDVEIIFPAYLRRVIGSMKKILQRIWHQIQVCLFNNGGRLKSTEIEKKMIELYRYKILPSLDHWGFSNMEEFIEYLMEQFKAQSDKLRFIPDPKLHRKGDKAKFLIRVHKGNEELIRITERYFNPLDLQSILKHSTSGIPNSEFIGHSEEYNYERDEILPGDKVMTLPLDIYSPIKFYVIKDEHFNQVTEMIRELTALFSGARNNRELLNKSAARFEHLRIGAVVAAFFEYDDGGSVGEWQRGRIVKLNQEKKSAIVFSVDLAFQMEISVKNIRYLPRNFFAMKAQAISSCLSYGVYPEEYWKPTRSNNPDDPRYFKDVYKHCFSELLKKRICETIFLNITKMKTEQKFSWAVSLGVVSIETDRGLYVPIERLHPSSYKGYHTVTANFMYNSRKKLKEIRKKAKNEASIQQGAGPSGDQNQQGAGPSGDQNQQGAGPSGDKDQQGADPSGDQDATKTSK